LTEFIKIFKRQNGALESASTMEEQSADNQNFHFSPASSSPPQHNDGYVDKPASTINIQPKGLPRTHIIKENSLLAEISATFATASQQNLARYAPTNGVIQSPNQQLTRSTAPFGHFNHHNSSNEWDFG
jgi:hypothetical protein